MEQKIQQMIENLNDFGIDSKQILEFSDYETLEEIHMAIEDYKKSKNEPKFEDSLW